ncbi:MAG: TerB family tellurite resistance protein [Candidatus Eremiobacteraeota bacterium]|nr:TerB family tellurite resistance protein [Candidatus Eremiobacteraeota bacterium]
MSESLQAVIRALFQVAWADQVVSPVEVNALTNILRHFGLSLPEVICLLDQNLAEPPEGAPVPLDQYFDDRETRMLALQSLMTVCFADGVLQPEEAGYIEGLVVRMGLGAAELEEVRQKVTGGH